MSITKRISLSALAIFTLVALVGPVIGQANWTPAPGTPPEGNPSPPIHTGDEYQEKNGVLKALGLITRTLDVFINGTYTGSVLKIRENTTKFPNYNDYAVSIATYGAVGGNNGRKGGLIVQAGWSNTTSTIAQFSALTSGYLEVPRMTILSSGRVGIGTTSPDTQINDADGNKVGDVLLHVTEWIKAKGLRADDIIVDNLTVNDNFYFEDYLLGFWKKVSSESPHIYYDEGGVVVGDTGARNPIQSIYGGIGKLTVYDGDIWLTNKAVTSDKITKTYYYQLLAEHISRESVGTYTNANDSTYRCPFDIEQNNDEGLSTVGNCTLIGNDNDPQYDDLIETYIDYGLPKEITIYDEGYTPYTSFASMKPRGERDNEVFCYDWYEDQGPRAKYYEVFVRQTSAEEQFFPGIGSLAFFDQKNEPYAGYISADDGKIKLGQGFRHFQDQGNFDKPDMYLGNLNPFMTINYRVSDNTKIGNIGIGTVDPQERFHVVGRTRLVGELNSFGGANFLQGRVGIGTSSPARNLHIFSNSSDPVLAVERRDSTDSTKDGALLFIIQNEYNSIYSRTGNAGAVRDFRIVTGNDERLRITSGGNVGIGTTSPGVALEVAPHVNQAAIRVGRRVGQASIEGLGGWLMLEGQNNGKVGINYYSNNDVILAHGGGKVGIGTNAPNEKLHVVGNALLALDPNAAEDELWYIIQTQDTSARFSTSRQTGSFTVNGKTYTNRCTCGANPPFDSYSCDNVISAQSANTLCWDERTGTLDGINGYYRAGVEVLPRTGLAAQVPTLKFGAVIANGGRGGMGLTKSGGLYIRNDIGQSINMSLGGQVGIGATQTATKLAIQGNVAIGEYFGMSAPRDGLIVSGNVGIGTSSPARNLHIFSNSSNPVLAVERRDSTDSTKDGALLFIIQNEYNSIYSRTGNTGAARDFRIVTGNNERLRITSGGNVGIGTHSPTSRLHISDNSGGGSTANFVIAQDGNSGNYTGHWKLGDPAMIFGHNSSGRDIEFQINNITRMGINRNGYTFLRGAPDLNNQYEQLRIGRSDNPNVRYHSLVSRHSTDDNSYLQFNIHNGKLEQTTAQKNVLKLLGSGRVEIGGGRFIVNATPVSGYNAFWNMDDTGIKFGNNSRLRNIEFQVATLVNNQQRIITPLSIATGDEGAYTFLSAAKGYDKAYEQLRIGRNDNSSVRYHSIFSQHGSAGNSWLQFRIHDGGGSPYTAQRTLMEMRGDRGTVSVFSSPTTAHAGGLVLTNSLNRTNNTRGFLLSSAYAGGTPEMKIQRYNIGTGGRADIMLIKGYKMSLTANHTNNISGDHDVVTKKYLANGQWYGDDPVMYECVYKMTYHSATVVKNMRYEIDLRYGDVDRCMAGGRKKLWARGNVTDGTLFSAKEDGVAYVRGTHPFYEFNVDYDSIWFEVDSGYIPISCGILTDGGNSEDIGRSYSDRKKCRVNTTNKNIKGASFTAVRSAIVDSPKQW